MKNNWTWYGNAGHFICAQWCEFHLCTKVGNYLVSTVGQYMPPESSREIIARSRGVELDGRGDARLADYLKKIGYEDIGFERKFETMVFRAGERCAEPTCNCGMPRIDGSALECSGYNTAGEAAAGHLELCNKFDRMKPSVGT